MSDKHTAGPWNLNPQPNPNKPRYYTVYVKPGGPETVEHICRVDMQMSKDWQANAKLISAAPDLLEACGRVINAYECFRLDLITGGLPCTCIVCLAEKAINKATT